MQIAAIQGTSQIDYPGNVTTVIWTQGCNRRCEYCHNSYMIPIRPTEMQWKDAREFLYPRKGFIDAVLFSGGEPTIQDDLTDCMTEIKEMGLKVAMHTNGDGPEYRFAAPLCSYILLSHYDIEKIEIGKQAGELWLSTVVNVNGLWENKIERAY